MKPAERRAAPAKDDIVALEPFTGLGLGDICVPRTAPELEHAWGQLTAHEFVGFDTESKPTFVKGETSAGPDVVQFATPTKAFVFQLHDAASLDVVRRLLTAPQLVKAGFGLDQDQTQLQRRFGVRAQPVLDLDVVFRRRGYPKTLGVKGAVAVMFGQRLMKSKRVTTTNWANRQLEPRQLLYAANDAYAALRVLMALDLPRDQLPVWHNGRAPHSPPRSRGAPATP